MAIPITCPGCRAAFDVPDNLAGKTIRCTACKTQVTIPAVVVDAEPVDDGGKKPFGWAAGQQPPAAAPKPGAIVPVKPTPVKPATASVAPVKTRRDDDEDDDRGRDRDRRRRDDDDDDRDRPRSGRPAPRERALAGRPRGGRRRDDDDEDDDDRPRRRKSGGGGGLVAILVGGALAVFAVIGLVVWLIASGMKQVADDLADAGPGQTEPKKVAPAAPGNWKPVANPDGFTAEMPGTPKVTADKAPYKGGLRDVKMYLWEKGDEAGLLIGYLQLTRSEAPTNPEETRQFLAGLTGPAGVGTQLGGFGRRKSGGIKDVTQDGFPGKEVWSDDPVEGNLTIRMVLAHDRLYLLGGGGKGSDAATQLARFLATVRITYKPSAPLDGGPVVTTPPKRGTTGDPDRDPDRWNWMTFGVDGYSVEVPGAMRLDPGGRNETDAKGRPVRMRVRELKRGIGPNRPEFTTGYIEYQPGVIPSGDAGAAFADEFLDVMGTKSAFNITDRKPITVDGFPGREFTATDKGNVDYRAAGKVVVAGDRVYHFTAAGLVKDGAETFSKRFVDSVKITYRPAGAPPVAVAPGSGDPPPPPPGINGPPGGAPGEWAKFTGEGFTADLPGKPQVLGNPPANPAAVGTQMYLLRTPDVRGSYHVNYLSHAPAIGQLWARNPQAAQNTLDAGLGVHNKQPGDAAPGLGRQLEIKEVKTVAVDGYPGREVRLGGKGSGLFRSVLVGNRVYTYGAAHDSDPEFVTQAEKMVNSFKVTYTPPAGGAMAGPGRPPPAGPPAFPNTPPPSAPVAGEVSPTPVATLTPFYAIAHDPDRNDAFAVGIREQGRGVGMLARYTTPGYKKEGEYVLPGLATRAAIDTKRGLLYAAVATPTGAALTNVLALMYDRAEAVGNLHVYDLNAIRAGKVEILSTLKPAAVITVGAWIVGLETAGDGKSLYVATLTTTAKGSSSELLLVDTATQKVTKRMSLPDPVGDMRYAGDGKSLVLVGMPFGPAGRLSATKVVSLLLVDPVKWAKAKTVALPAGAAQDVFPLKNGKFLAAVLVPPAPGQTAPNRKVYLLDPDGGPKEVALGGGPGAANNGYARLSPDGKYLLVSSRMADGLDVYEVADPETADGAQKVASARAAGGLKLGGNFYFSPDEKQVVFQTGAVLDVDAIRGAPPAGAAPGGARPEGVPPPGSP